MMDAQADLSLRWANSHVVGFVTSRLICKCNFLQLYFLKLDIIIYMLKFMSIVYAEHRLPLNIIYFTSTEKAQRTLKRTLEGAVLAFCGFTWWKKPECPEETTDLGRATTTHRDFLSTTERGSNFERRLFVSFHDIMVLTIQLAIKHRGDTKFIVILWPDISVLQQLASIIRFSHAYKDQRVNLK